MPTAAISISYYSESLANTIWQEKETRDENICK